MKANRLPEIAHPITLAAVALAALAFASTANVQFKAVRDDGLPKSGKCSTSAKPQPPLPSQSPAMACSKCADVLTTELNRQAKGGELLAGAASKIVAKHTCTACETKLTVAGEGKAKHTVATHKCTADVPNPLTCCASILLEPGHCILKHQSHLQGL